MSNPRQPRPPPAPPPTTSHPPVRPSPPRQSTSSPAPHRPHSFSLSPPPLSATHIPPPLPRYTLAYLLLASPPIRGHILSLLPPQTLVTFRLVCKAFAEYAKPYLFMEVWIQVNSQKWMGRKLAALESVGGGVRRLVVVGRHRQEVGPVREGTAGGFVGDTRIPYKEEGEFEFEFVEAGNVELGQLGNFESFGRERRRRERKLIWREKEHLNPVPEIIEFRIMGERDNRAGEGDSGGGRSEPRPTQQGKGEKDLKSGRGKPQRIPIPTQKSGGPIDTTAYGPLYHSVSNTSLPRWIHLFRCMPNLASLVIQAPGLDHAWEYTCIDILLSTIRQAMTAVGTRLEELACLPVNILGLEGLGSVGIREDTEAQGGAVLGWGGLKRCELSVNARMVLGGGGVVAGDEEGEGRSKDVYGRIVRGFLLSLGEKGREGLEVLKFQWLGGGKVGDEILECPFLVLPSSLPSQSFQSSAAAVKPSPSHPQLQPPRIPGIIDESPLICALLTFPSLTRIYIRNVSFAAPALTQFLEHRAQKCTWMSLRECVVRDGGVKEAVGRRWKVVWESMEGEKERRRTSGDYQKIDIFWWVVDREERMGKVGMVRDKVKKKG